ncbi:MAG: hypothetical protein ACM339_12670, partial [Ignavibacteria bacterium]
AAIGVLAIGALAIRKLSKQNYRFKKINIDELDVAQLRVNNITITGELLLPEKSDNARKVIPKKRTVRKKKIETKGS